MCNKPCVAIIVLTRAVEKALSDINDQLFGLERDCANRHDNLGNDLREEIASIEREVSYLRRDSHDNHYDLEGSINRLRGQISDLESKSLRHHGPW